MENKVGNNIIIKYLKIKKELPYTPDVSQIIYIEGEYKEALNKYIKNNIDTISSFFKEKNKEFIYIPHIVDYIKSNSRYYNPYQKEDKHSNSITSNLISNQIFSYCIDEVSIQSGLIRYKGITDNYYIFSYNTFDDNIDETNLLKNIQKYASLLKSDYQNYPSPYHPYIENPEDNADYDFDSESKKLIDEIKERVEILKQKGINEMILKSILSIDSVELSRLVITNEYKIFLPDYNNLEITMYPLPKAVYFLFLNHPEGILFKHLPGYRDELIAMYKKVSGRENIEDIEKSINDVVNPTLNSINEKCSRIREAFIKHFDEAIAKNYFVTGDRATPKKISLNRSLVVLEEVQIKVDVKKTPFEYVKHEHPNNKYSLESTTLEDDLPF